MQRGCCILLSRIAGSTGEVVAVEAGLFAVERCENAAAGAGACVGAGEDSGAEVSHRLDAFEDATAAGLRALPDWRGKASLAFEWKHVRERHGPLRGTWHLRLADGSSMSMPRGSRMSWAVAATGYWDRHLVDFVESFVAPRTLVLDIGASLGLWAVPLGRIARERDGLLRCFEPNPDNIPWLSSNIEANGLRGVTEIHAFAVGAHKGSAYLGFREPGGGNGAIRPDADAAVPVEVKRIDDSDFPMPVSFVKMDVEGFELEVMRGASELLERDRPVIFGEFSAIWLRERGEDLPAHLRGLSAIGYDIFAVEQHRSSRWRPNDVASLRRLRPPFATAGENLLLVPS